jgi:hypothetical protein
MNDIKLHRLTRFKVSCRSSCACVNQSEATYGGEKLQGVIGTVRSTLQHLVSAEAEHMGAEKGVWRTGWAQCEWGRAPED